MPNPRPEPNLQGVYYSGRNDLFVTAHSVTTKSIRDTDFTAYRNIITQRPNITRIGDTDDEVVVIPARIVLVQIEKPGAIKTLRRESASKKKIEFCRDRGIELV